MIRTIKSQKFEVDPGTPVTVPVTPGLTYIVAIGGDTEGVEINALLNFDEDPCPAPFSEEALLPGVYLLEAPTDQMQFTTLVQSACIVMHTNPTTTINVGSSTYA
jgi:hypothetical protein